jgi:hypothetical protein
MGKEEAEARARAEMEWVAGVAIGMFIVEVEAEAAARRNESTACSIFDCLVKRRKGIVQRGSYLRIATPTQACRNVAIAALESGTEHTWKLPCLRIQI